MPERRVRLDRVLRDGEDDHRDAEAGIADLLDQLGTLDPALEQGVDHDDVRAHLGDRRDRASALGQHFEELDPGLRFEEATDVLSDLRDVLDDQQARLVTGRHHLDDTTRVPRGTPSGRPGAGRVGGPSLDASRPRRWPACQGLTAIRIARSLPGPIGPRP